MLWRNQRWHYISVTGNSPFTYAWSSGAVRWGFGKCGGKYLYRYCYR
ncbi:MAG: hypothetical protein R2847_03525 [Bacteroidia bacterium]